MDTFIIGAGGHGRVVLDILRRGRQYRPVGFLDANATLSGCEIAGVAVLGAINHLPKLAAQHKVRHAIVAIGDNRVRRGYARLALDAGLELINAIHPSATLSPTASLGRNVVIAAGACVCTDASIGDCAIINTHAVVDHECEIGEGVHVCPGAILAGRVRVGDGAFVGMGAKVVQCRTIGDDSTVGAGAVVLNDVPLCATVVGVPARVIKSVSRAAG
jgi:UDP-perosamine 4-acetyltransferase